MAHLQAVATAQRTLGGRLADVNAVAAELQRRGCVVLSATVTADRAWVEIRRPPGRAGLEGVTKVRRPGSETLAAVFGGCEVNWEVVA